MRAAPYIAQVAVILIKGTKQGPPTIRTSMQKSSFCVGSAGQSGADAIANTAATASADVATTIIIIIDYELPLFLQAIVSISCTIV